MDDWTWNAEDGVFIDSEGRRYEPHWTREGEPVGGWGGCPGRPPSVGDVAVCSVGRIGVVTAAEKQTVRYRDGTTGLTYTGICLTDGSAWSSRTPCVIGRLWDYRDVAEAIAGVPHGWPRIAETQWSIYGWGLNTFGSPRPMDPRMERSATGLAHAAKEQARRLLEDAQAVGGVFLVAARLNEELAELLIECAKLEPDSGAVGSEIGDVLIIAQQVAAVVGVNSWFEVERKMAVNRRREWNTGGMGVGQHR